MKYFFTLCTLAFALSSCGQPGTSAGSNEPVEPLQNEKQTEIQATTYTMDEIVTHSSKESCWSVIDGKVYDFTLYIYDHPGGSNNVLKTCGIDASEIYGGKHGASEKANMKLESFIIGTLDSSDEV